MRFATPVLFALTTALFAGCSTHERANADAFRWDGPIPAAGTLHVRNMNGPVRVVEGKGRDIRVRAEVRWRHGPQHDVHFVTKRIGDDLYVCALWTRKGRCDDKGYTAKRSPSRRFWGFRKGSDAKVTFLVELPAGTPVDASTVNGEMVVDAVRARVRASTVNGDVRIGTSTGPVRARTVNGDVQVRVAALPGGEGISLETVNGSVEAELPTQLDGDVRLSTVNGGLSTDYPVTIQGTQRRRLQATLGAGGRPIVLETVNGNVALRKLRS